MHDRKGPQCAGSHKIALQPTTVHRKVQGLPDTLKHTYGLKDVNRSPLLWINMMSNGDELASIELLKHGGVRGGQ